MRLLIQILAGVFSVLTMSYHDGLKAQVLNYKPLSMEVSATDRIQLSGFRGKVTFKSTPGRVLTVQLKQTNPSQMSAELKETLDEWLFSMQKSEGVVQIHVRSPQSKKVWARLLSEKSALPQFDLVIQGPSLPATVSWREGEVLVDGLKHPLQVRLQDGKVSVLNHSASLDISHGSGEVTLKNIDGDVDVESFAGKLKLSQIKGRMVVRNFSGSTGISEGVGSILTSSYDGSVQIDNSQAKLEFKIEKGSVRTTKHTGDIRGSTNQGAVTLNTVGRSSVNIESKDGPISLQMVDSGASVNVATKEGALSLPDYLQVIRQPQQRLARGRLRGSQPGQVFIRTENGSVRLR